MPSLGKSPFPTCPNIIFTHQGVSKLLSGLQPHKATGPDCLPPRILRDLAEEIAPSLCLIFQQIYNTGETPQDWRDAIVTPIYKKGNKHDPQNYRPVSLTSIACKIFEHVLCSAIMTHLNSCGVLTNDQHGFRKGLSTETQLLAAVHDWSHALHEGRQTDVLFLDFSKAFDSVPNGRLVEKLRYYGISGKANRVIESLLRSRRQRVAVNGSLSQWVPVTSGVPQGTVVGPILFLIYINDIQSGISSRMRLFADDSVIYRSIDTNNDHLALRDDLARLDQWASTWQMTFKPEKCYVMSITNKRSASVFQYSLKGVPLQTVSSWPYLGVEIDNKLTWTPHLNKVIRSATRTLGVVQRTLHAAPQACRRVAYQALIRPKLEYASTAWSPQTPGKIRQLEAVQSKAARFVAHSYSRHTSATALKSNLGWPPLALRRDYRDSVMWYKIHHGLVHITFPDIVVPKQRLGRHDHILAYRQVRPRVEAYRHSFYVRTIPLWNSLPASVVSSPSLTVFQRSAMLNICGGANP